MVKIWFDSNYAEALLKHKSFSKILKYLKIIY
jgi:hypothetical protein